MAIVTVDLSALVKELGTQLGLPAAALDKLPPDTGVITVMRSDQLSAAQTGVRAIKILSVWLLVLVLVLFGVGDLPRARAPARDATHDRLGLRLRRPSRARRLDGSSGTTGRRARRGPSSMLPLTTSG